MATYHANTSLKVNATVDQTLGIGASYAAPANGCAIFTIVSTGAGAGGGSINVGGVAMYTFSSTIGFRGLGTSINGATSAHIVLGPSHSIVINSSTGHAVGTSFYIRGVEYVNSP